MTAPSPLWFGGGTHLLAGEGVGGPNSEEGTDTVVLKVYMYFVRYKFMHLLYIYYNDQDGWQGGTWSQRDPPAPDSSGRNRLGDPAAGHDGPGLLDRVHWSRAGHWSARLQRRLLAGCPRGGDGGRRVYTSSAPLSLPCGIKNPRIRPFMSGPYAGTIPAEILPLEPEAERALVGTLLQDLNEKFCVNLDPNPSLDRSIPPPSTVHNTGRTVFIGGSNLGRIAKSAAENGHMTVDLTAKGWIPKSGKMLGCARL